MSSPPRLMLSKRSSAAITAGKCDVLKNSDLGGKTISRYYISRALRYPVVCPIRIKSTTIIIFHTKVIPILLLNVVYKIIDIRGYYLTIVDPVHSVAHKKYQFLYMIQSSNFIRNIRCNAVQK